MTMRKRLVSKTRKVDLKNIDSKDAEEMIFSYQQRAKEEVPLRINEKLTILVTADKCNEKYRQQYIKKKML